MIGLWVMVMLDRLMVVSDRLLMMNMVDIRFMVSMMSLGRIILVIVLVAVRLVHWLRIMLHGWLNRLHWDHRKCRSNWSYRSCNRKDGIIVLINIIHKDFLKVNGIIIIEVKHVSCRGFFFAIIQIIKPEHILIIALQPKQ